MSLDQRNSIKSRLELDPMSKSYLGMPPTTNSNLFNHTLNQVDTELNEVTETSSQYKKVSDQDEQHHVTLEVRQPNLEAINTEKEITSVKISPMPVTAVNSSPSNSNTVTYQNQNSSSSVFLGNNGQKPVLATIESDSKSGTSKE